MHRSFSDVSILYVERVQRQVGMPANGADVSTGKLSSDTYSREQEEE